MQIPQGCWLHPLFLTSAATGRKDRRCKWPVQTGRLVLSAALWEVWEEGLPCWEFLASPKQGLSLGSPSLKQWAAESDASTYTLSAALLWNTTAWLIDCTLVSVASWALSWIGFPLTNQAPSPHFNINWLEMLLTVPSGCINFLQIEFGLMRQETWNYSWHLLHTQNNHSNAFREACSSRVVTDQSWGGGRHKKGGRASLGSHLSTCKRHQ